METAKHYEYVHQLLQDSSDNCLFTSGDFSLLGFFNDQQPFFDPLSNFNNDESRNGLKILQDSFGDIRVNNKLFIRKECDMQSDDKKAFTEKYRCEVERVDIKDPDSMQNVSRWIKQQTDKEKFEFFNWTSLNAVFNFSSEWGVNFDNNNNYKSKFRISDNQAADVDMMKMEGTFNYENNTDFNVDVLEIPFKAKGLSMVIILPNNEADIGQLLQNIDSYSFGGLFNPERKHRISLHLPKLKVEAVMDISQKKDYGKMPLEITTTSKYNANTILSKTLLEIDEFGTKSLSLTSGKLLIDPIVKEFLVQTDVANRFAKTLITNKVENLEDVAQETIFNVILPENAFISEFIMEIEGKSYKSYVKEKEEAKEEYTEAVSKGKSAAHVAVSARDSNKFTVNVNIAPLSTATFHLTYEELLQRICKQYQLVLNLHPGQLIDVLKVKVNIDESRKLKYVETPEFRSGNEISETEEKNPLTTIEVSDSKAVIKFEPNLEAQKELIKKFEKQEAYGVSGQFIVNYDVELDPNKGEVLLNDGYFVYFYAPDDLPPLAKHVVFALDTSGSMGGRKIEQLRDAMKSILDQIRNNDLVSILEFNTDIVIHDIDKMTAIRVKYGMEENYYEPFYKFEELKLPHPKPASENIEKAKQVVSRLQATTSTHMIGGLEAALYLVNMVQAKYHTHQPMIIFLTDGQPTDGITDHKEIIEVVTKLNNANHKAPIFSLSFGEGAEKSFLRELSLKNSGFSRHIYEASDASLQLQQFYKHISSPLLSNVNFKYENGVEEVTRTFFPIYFCGTHIVISGRYTDANAPLIIHTLPGGHTVCPVSKKSATPIERLWAYLTVKQILDEKDVTQDKAKLKKALELALKYSFVTEVTSLVVVKPDEDSASVNTQNAMENENDYSNFGGPGYTPMRAMAYSGFGPQSSSFGAQNLCGMPIRNLRMCSGEAHLSMNYTPMGPPQGLFGTTAAYNSVPGVHRVFGGAGGQSCGIRLNNAVATGFFGGPSSNAFSLNQSLNLKASNRSQPSNIASFGASKVSAFGSTKMATFGSPNVNTFGSPNVSAPTFGSSNTTTFGSPNITTFGSPNMSTFGSQGYMYDKFRAQGQPASLQQFTNFGSVIQQPSMINQPSKGEIFGKIVFGAGAAEEMESCGSTEDIYMKTQMEDETDMANNMPKEEPEPSPLKEFKVDRPFFCMVKAKLNDNHYIVFAGRICKL